MKKILSLTIPILLGSSYAMADEIKDQVEEPPVYQETLTEIYDLVHEHGKEFGKDKGITRKVINVYSEDILGKNAAIVVIDNKGKGGLFKPKKGKSAVINFTNLKIDGITSRIYDKGANGIDLHINDERDLCKKIGEVNKDVCYNKIFVDLRNKIVEKLENKIAKK
ncbi:hypothetical protein ACFL1H_01460 [Nanoarchaeota archaeon]